MPHHLHVLSESSQWKISTFSAITVVQGGGAVGPLSPALPLHLTAAASDRLAVGHRGEGATKVLLGNCSIYLFIYFQPTCTAA